MNKIMILLLALLFLGCESFGVFKHEHEDEQGGVCISYVNAPQDSQSEDEYQCYSNWTHAKCVVAEAYNESYDWDEYHLEQNNIWER